MRLQDLEWAERKKNTSPHGKKYGQAECVAGPKECSLLAINCQAEWERGKATLWFKSFGDFCPWLQQNVPGEFKNLVENGVQEQVHCSAEKPLKSKQRLKMFFFHKIHSCKSLRIVNKPDFQDLFIYLVTR